MSATARYAAIICSNCGESKNRSIVQAVTAKPKHLSKKFIMDSASVAERRSITLGERRDWKATALQAVH